MTIDDGFMQPFRIDPKLKHPKTGHDETTEGHEYQQRGSQALSAILLESADAIFVPQNQHHIAFLEDRSRIGQFVDDLFIVLAASV